VSPCLTQTRPLQVESRGFRAIVRHSSRPWPASRESGRPRVGVRTSAFRRRRHSREYSGLSMPAVTFLNIRRSERHEVFGRSAAVRSVGVQYFIMAHHNNGSVVPIRGNPGYSLTIPPQNCPHDTCADLPRYPSPPLCSRQGLTRSNRRGTDPYAWWCGRGDAARRPAIPILGHEDQFPPPRLSVG
jgi:hypothetical protein